MTAEMYKLLSDKLSTNAIQRTKSSETRKGYDTTGYAYQYIVNRFNEVFLDQWGFDFYTVKEIQGSYKSGQPYHELTVICSIWVVDRQSARAAAGGHISATYFDALKGAQTNAFKKCAAFWGAGKEAYEGTIDDDLVPFPDSNENKIITDRVNCPQCGAEMLESKFADAGKKFLYCSKYRAGCNAKIYL